jgi:phenylacetic acid degradation protein paaN
MSLFEKHQSLLDQAARAVEQRGFFAAYPEVPKAYGEEAIAAGATAYKNFLGKKFELPAQGNPSSWKGEETSPYTQESLDIAYPIYETIDLITKATVAFNKWRKVKAADRAALLAESLERMKTYFFEIAHATQHTTGQSWIMSFQASGPHAADHALEAIALGYHEQTRFPEKVLWEKPMGKFSVKIEKTFVPEPRGISLVIGCSTFPLWNSLPGMYASLVTGNAVIVKPHPKAILPMAICVKMLQQVLEENQMDPCLVQLAADSSAEQNTKEIAAHPAVKIIDYTGGTDFGEYIESIPGKTVFTEKTGVNSVIIDSAKDIDAVLENLAFSVSLYSGQMCTAPQNFFIPESVKVGEQVLSFDEVAAKLKEKVDALVKNPKMGAGVLGAVQSERTASRVQTASGMGTKLLLPSESVANAEYAHARTVSPLLIEAAAADVNLFESELFGPIAVAIRTHSTDESIALAKELAAKHGAITCAAYSTDENVMEKIAEEMNSVFTPVTFNFTGPIWVNQHAAFSDFHVTGGNAAGNGSFTNPEFIVKRFVWVGNRKMIS